MNLEKIFLAILDLLKALTKAFIIIFLLIIIIVLLFMTNENLYSYKIEFIIIIFSQNVLFTKNV